MLLMLSVLAFNTRQFTWYIDVVLVLGITLAYLVSASNSSKSLPVSIFDQRKQKVQLFLESWQPWVPGGIFARTYKFGAIVWHLPYLF